MKSCVAHRSRWPGEHIRERMEEKKEQAKEDIESIFTNEIDREGKALSLKMKTIARAKSLAARYFAVADNYNGDSNVKKMSAAFVYMASVIENDRRRQIDISSVSGVNISAISSWYNDIIRNFGMKIIANGDHVICTIEEKESED